MRYSSIVIANSASRPASWQSLSAVLLSRLPIVALGSQLVTMSAHMSPLEHSGEPSAWPGPSPGWPSACPGPSPCRRHLAWRPWPRLGWLAGCAASATASLALRGTESRAGLRRVDRRATGETPTMEAVRANAVRAAASPADSPGPPGRPGQRDSHHRMQLIRSIQRERPSVSSMSSSGSTGSRRAGRIRGIQASHSNKPSGMLVALHSPGPPSRPADETVMRSPAL